MDCNINIHLIVTVIILSDFFPLRVKKIADANQTLTQPPNMIRRLERKLLLQINHQMSAA